MSQINTLELRDRLISRVVEYALDDHFVRDSALTKLMREIWSGPPELGGLGGDLWVEGAFPPLPASETMEQLVSRNLVNRELADHLDKAGVFQLKNRPYQHQLESIECAFSNSKQKNQRPCIVVSAGTGAGKTESFLLPMLNELWSSPAKQGSGMSALILYPMNALVNDQVGRLERWLGWQNRLSFFHFTSETPEDSKAANDRGLPNAAAWKFRTRQQARGCEDANGKRIPTGDGPNPDIVVTNYSMLEYMLCRPQDEVFFGSNLRVVVLDEAHIYSGNLAAEMTLLLRRLLMRCGRKSDEVLFIATSATIGGGKNELKPFSAKLFSKPENLVRVIIGKQSKPQFEAVPSQLPIGSDFLNKILENPLPSDETLQSNNGETFFPKATDDAWNRCCNFAKALVPPDKYKRATDAAAQDKFVGPFLASSLTYSGVLAALQSILWNGGNPQRIQLKNLAEELFGNTQDAVEATRRILQAGAIARSEPGVLPLVPNRVHYLMRGPEGFLIAFGASKEKGLFELQDKRFIFSAGSDLNVLGAIEQHPLTLFRCNESGWWGVAGKQVNGHLEPVPSSVVLYGDDELPEFDAENPASQNQTPIRFFSLVEILGKPSIWFSPTTGNYGHEGEIQLWIVGECPVSGAPLSPSTVGWFSARARLQLSVIAETALAAMPEYPDNTKVWKPARGRRLLVFSDSRAEAARLGPRLTRQHELQVFRAAVIDRLDKITLAATTDELAELRDEISELKSQFELASDAKKVRLSRKIEQAEIEVAQSEAGGSIDDWRKALEQSIIIRELYFAPDGGGHQPGSNNSSEIWSKNTKKIQESLASLLGRELARRPVWPRLSLETLGLVEVVYPGITKLSPPAAFLGVLPSALIFRIEALWPDYLSALLDSVRNQGAVSLGSPSDDSDYQYGNGFIGKFFAQDQGYRRSLIPLVGEHVEGQQVSRRNVFTRCILETLGLSRQKSVDWTKQMMIAAFEALLQAGNSGEFPWLLVKSDLPTNSDQIVSGMQIAFNQLSLRRPSTLYKCEYTGQVWPRSVEGLYPGAKSSCLKEVAHDLVDADIRLGRRRKELRDWIGFKLGLWAEEHSAQLSPSENSRLQDLFREGTRNILSSTTTLELGIDIGGLSAVLLGNLPPGKANYLQRAGRAGRRADGTSAVLGFARPSAYERAVFLNFKGYLQQELRRPTVFLDRAPLTRRHAHAWLLGEFFKKHSRSHATGAMDAFGRMGPFTGQPLPSIWKKGEDKPVLGIADQFSVAKKFIDFLDDLLLTPAEDFQEQLIRLWDKCGNVDSSPSSWQHNIESIRNSFKKAVNNWEKIYGELLDAWSEVRHDNTRNNSISYIRAQANAIFFQLLTLHKLTVIESLADERVLPRYGFPIGLSRLRVQIPDGSKKTREEDQFRLQRDSMMALREYTPGSQMLAGGKVVTSRGLLKHWTGAIVNDEAWGLRGKFAKTTSGLLNYSLSAVPPVPPTSGTGAGLQTGEFIFPKHGFTTAAWDPPNYGSDFEKIGDLEVFTLAFANLQLCDSPINSFAGVQGCVATYRNAGELFLLNSGAHKKGFAVCQKCGYAESEWRQGKTGRVDLPNRFEHHAPLNSSNDRIHCWSQQEAPVWRNQHLAAKQSTNLLMLDFGASRNSNNKSLLYTIGQALKLAGASLLEVDQREIGLLVPVPDSASGIYQCVILYDSLAGGSGHLEELSHKSSHTIHKEWLERAVSLLYVDGNIPDLVKHREAVRRLLTSSCDENLLDPLGALQFLQGLMSGMHAQQVNAHQHIIDLNRLGDGEIPEDFYVLLRANEIAGEPQGSLRLKRWFQNGHPTPNQLIVVRVPQGGIAIGKWFYSEQTDQNRPHRVRIRNNHNPIIMELTNSEFANLKLIATKF